MGLEAMLTSLPKDVCTTLLLRFYSTERGQKIVAPRYAIHLIEGSEISWAARGLTMLEIFPKDPRICELTRDMVEVMQPYAVEVSACFAFLKPVMDPSLSMHELRLLSRVGIKHMLNL